VGFFIVVLVVAADQEEAAACLRAVRTTADWVVTDPAAAVAFPALAHRLLELRLEAVAVQECLGGLHGPTMGRK
jgi:hypothetical protein